MNEEFNLVDKARQICIDLEFSPNYDDACDFLNKVRENLQNEMSNSMILEIKYAIIKCFSNFTAQLSDFLDDYIKNYKTNENYIVITANILSEIKQNGYHSQISDSLFLVNETLDLISPQLNQNDMMLFGHIIRPQFKTNLIIDLLNSSELSIESIHIFFPFIYSENILNQNLGQNNNLLLKNMSDLNLQILPQTSESYEEISNYIKNPQTNSIFEMNEAALSVFEESLLFIKVNAEKQMECLTKDIVLPFIAISLIYIQKSKCNVDFPKNEFSNLIIKCIESLRNNCLPVFTISMDSILSNYLSLYENVLISFDSLLQILEILLKQLINNEYLGNKMILLSTIFKLSTTNSFKNFKSSINDFFKKNQNIILQYIIDNLQEINTNNHQMKAILDLNVFDSKLIFDQLRDISLFENLTKFIDKYCFSKKKYLSSFLLSFIKEKINEEKWEDVIQISNYMKKGEWFLQPQEIKDMLLPYNVKEILFGNVIYDEDTIDEIIDHILNDSHPEKNSDNFLLLFYKMIQDEVLLQGYLTYIIAWNYKSYYSLESYLTLFKKEYELYQKDFILVTNKIFRFLEEEKVLLLRLDFKITSLPSTKFGLYIISKLYKSIEEKNGNFQAFLCLQNISNSFPFLFEANIQHLLDIILPSFEYISYAFEDNPNEEQIVLAKTSYAAISFLISTLRSPIVREAFLNRFFENIESYSNSQIFCILNALRCLTKEYIDIKIYQKYIIKYNFFEIIDKLFQREIQSMRFKLLFKYQIYLFLSKEYNELQKMTDSMIIQCFYSKDDKFPLNYVQNISYCSLISIDNSISIKFCDVPSDIFEFLYRINRCFQFSLYYNFQRYRKEPPTSNLIDEFSSKLIKDKPHHQNLKKLIYNGQITTTMNHYLESLPQCIRDLILNSYKNENIYLSSEMYDIYSQAIDTLNELISRPENDLNNVNEPTNYKNYYLILLYNQKILFKNMIKDMYGISKDDDCHKMLLCIIDKIISDKRSFLTMIEIISDFLNYLHNYISIDDKESLLNVVFFLKKYANTNLHDFHQYFSEIGNQLLNIVLLPMFRYDQNILLKIYELLNIFNANNLPTQTNQFVSFLLLTRNQEMISYAMKIITKFQPKDIKQIKPLIETILNIEIDNYKISDSLVEYIAYLRMYSKDDLIFLINKLDAFLEKYSNRNQKNNILFIYICCLLNVLAPERQFPICFSGIINETVPIIPQYILEIFPAFWRMFSKYHSLIINLLQKNPYFLLREFKFLLEYPELVNFKIRSSYFRQIMNKRINKNKILYLDVENSNLFESSFNLLQNKTPDDLLSIFDVLFTDESNITVDAGGPTREWFDKLAKAIFNPNFALFECFVKTNSYQPSFNSSIQTNHLKYFYFVGQFIARALIQGICIDARLTISFCKQILNQSLELPDLKEIDEQIYNSLKWILNNDDVEQLCRTFVIEKEQFGTTTTIPLIENGDNIEITKENKNDYVELYFNYVLRKRIENQINCFCDGFNSLIHPDDIKIFSPNELQLIICGETHINVEDFIAHTIIEFPYTKDSLTIRLFFDLLHKWDNDKLVKLFMFMTGSSRVPTNGFEEFCQLSGYQFTIQAGGEKTSLPQSHTCFNTIDLPPYESEDELEQKLLMAIQECNTLQLY